jgi:hypothetical protein
MTAKPWQMLICHTRKEDKCRNRARRTVFQKEDYETLESNFPKFHQPIIDLESQSEKKQR